MAGLQDISPMVAKLWVTSAVRAPMRAAAAAASQPAWPPPMTMTSKRLALKPCVHGPYLSRSGTRRQSGLVSRKLFRTNCRCTSSKAVIHLPMQNSAKMAPKHLLDIDAAGEAAEVTGGEAKLLGLELRPAALAAKPFKRHGRSLELGPVAGAGDDGRLADGEALSARSARSSTSAATPSPVLADSARPSAICRGFDEINLVQYGDFAGLCRD